MIIPLDDLLREIPKYNDTLAIVSHLKDRVIPTMSEADAIEVLELCRNVVGMHTLLRSACHHLASKALDSA